jgi:hypothetical protein
MIAADLLIGLLLGYVIAVLILIAWEVSRD